MRYFPTFFDLKDQPALLVGGGASAARKLRLLRKAGARVTVVAPRVSAEIAALAADGQVRHTARGLVAGDVTSQRLVIAASGLEPVDRRAAEAATAAGIPVNVVDQPALSTFIMPAIVERDPLVIGISSGGASPVLARRVRERIEALLPAGLGRLAGFAQLFRRAVEAKLPAGAPRRAFWERFFDGPIARAVVAGDDIRARERMLRLINGGISSHAGAHGRAASGSVQIVGAGPGDPDLLTLKALRALQDADLVVYDRLVGPAILDYARRDAERIYVGKAKGNHVMSQGEINALLVHQARAGRRVVRLKGGDPFLFGRGGEEQAVLRAHGIEVQVIPGITAAAGCAAAAGIPLTLRGTSQALTLVTGHGAEGEPALDWAALAGSQQTLAIYMGVSSASATARRLIDHGLSPSTPVAVIENGTLPEQKTVIGQVSETARLIQDAGITGPALILVGEVVAQATIDDLAAPLRAAAS